MTKCKALFLALALAGATKTDSFAAAVRVTDPLIGAFASRPIAIDGSLDDWPGGRSSYFELTFPDSFAEKAVALAKNPALAKCRAEVMMTHNRENLYLGLRLPAADTVVNTAQEPDAWHDGGDGIIVNARDAEGKSFSVLWWGVDGTGAPRLAARRDGAPWQELGKFGGKAALRSAPGKGSAVEIQLPWSALGRTDAETSRLDLVWEAAFNGVSRETLKSVETSVRFISPPPLQTTFELPRDADISLGLFDAQGRLVRTIVMEEPRLAGVNVESWDGLDQWGKVIPPGDYLLKGIHFKPLKLEYVMTATSPGTPPWWTADGKGAWLSDEMAPQAVVTDGETVYAAAPGAEAGFSIIAIGPDGTRQWGVRPNIS